MSAYTRNGIYTAIRSAVLDADENAYCTSTYNQTPPKLPCVFIREIGRFQPTDSINLAFDEDIFNCTFEIQIFTNSATKQSDAYDIMDAVKTAMRSMYFILMSEAPIDNADENIYRLTARFSRTICGGDVMPTPPTPTPTPTPTPSDDDDEDEGENEEE